MKKKISLLPPGLYDLLPPDASKESDAIYKLLRVFSSFGYEQVSPPLMEYEATLLGGRGKDLSEQTCRVLDPLSHTMMGIRSDITLQVGRIASSRLASAPRPLRLCYAGTILQSRPEPLRNERQLAQAGVELIGSHSVRADAEVIMLAAEALELVGIKNISIDINLPGLVSELCPEASNNPSLQAQIKDALTQRNTDAIRSLPIANNILLASLVNSSGPVQSTLADLKKFKIPQADSIRELIERITTNYPKLKLTLDPIEYRGFDYHSGIGFSIFADGLRHELGRGGRYIVEHEHATGFTIYVTHILPLLPEIKKNKRILLADDIAVQEVVKLHAEGWTTMYSLSDNQEAEAKNLGCTQIMKKGKINSI